MEEQKIEVQKKSFLKTIKEFYYKHEKIFTPKFLLGAGLMIFIVFFVIYVSIVKIDNTGKSGVVAIEKGYVELAKKHNSVTAISRNDNEYEMEMDVNDVRILRHQVDAIDGGRDRIYFYIFVDYTIVTKDKTTVDGVYLYKLYFSGSTLVTEFIIDVADTDTAGVTSAVSTISELYIDGSGNEALRTVNDTNYRETYTPDTIKEDMAQKGEKVNLRKIMSYVEFGFKERVNSNATPNGNYVNWFMF